MLREVEMLVGTVFFLVELFFIIIFAVATAQVARLIVEELVYQWVLS
jgi:hypothetical protein